MKYHTLGSSNVSSQHKTSGFTLYADLGLSENEQRVYTENDMRKLRKELEMVQKDLKLQTKRCRHLVTEYTRQLQEKEESYQNEKALRDTQLTRVLRALLIFESRLKQEQKLISHQLNEKDDIIKAQTNDIKVLLSSQYCKNCNQYYTSPCTLESFDSSSEYAGERDYLSSNMESLDSSSDTYAAMERDYSKSESENYDKLSNKNIFEKSKSYSEIRRKVGHKKNISTYFEVLKLRNDSPLSNDDNTSADLNNLDSLPPESISDTISVVSENIENMLSKTRNLRSPASESSANVSSSECDKTVINTVVMKSNDDSDSNKSCNKNNDNKHINDAVESPENKLTDTIPVFENNGDLNDNWYASASDQEDEDHRDIYRNNPVLECMNQILLQNINDINSPPKTPPHERKNNKRVKFLDEEDQKNNESSLLDQDTTHNNYYETPIQKTPNFYETPQSIYSNDYEQILSKCSDSSGQDFKPDGKKISKENYDYVQIEKDRIKSEPSARKNKILRVPPALPPKPSNLVAKSKFQTLPKQTPSENSSTDLEPDYCSISELNLPQNRAIGGKKISVVAEVHNPVNHNITHNTPSSPNVIEKSVHNADDILVLPSDNVPNLVVKKCVERLNVQMAKQTVTRPQQIKSSSRISKSKHDIDIPKLPQVSEIIIPDDPDDKDSDIISQDNYVKNKSQIMQEKQFLELKKPIIMGSSVSSLISGFNNHHLLKELKPKTEPTKLEFKKGFSSFEKLQNLDKPINKSSEKPLDTSCFENFDLSQNFEEFKLDDCEIEEYDVEEELEREELEKKKFEEVNKFVGSTIIKEVQEKRNYSHRNKLEYSRELDEQSKNRSPTSLEIVKRHVDFNKCSQQLKDTPQSPITYEHFLECTGLSSKSILTPARTLTNHKHMLKPKYIKHRSKVKANTNILEKNGGSAIRYWSEPYV